MRYSVTDQVQHLAERLRAFARERNWEQFHTPKNLVMAIAGEVGELTQHFQWLSPEESGLVETSVEERQAVAEELADVFIYLVRLADTLGVDLIEQAEEKIAKNEVRYPPDLVKGSAKKMP
jgi:NTP pyrophosphatase (non-canonical NTP hydrolase)